jgi:acetylornithine deacetylase
MEYPMTLSLDLLEKLVAFDTTSHKSNLALIAFIEAYLQARGFDTARAYDASGEKAGLFARIGPAAQPGILLSGHTDVVPVTGQHWDTDPFRLTQKGNALHGRGTTDMKGFIACALSLADRIHTKNLREPLKFAFSYEEEIGCVGIKRMIRNLDSTLGVPRLCIVGEPTEMHVAVGHKGKGALRALCHGQSGHSALAPHYVSALHLATDFVHELRDLQQYYRQHGAHDSDYVIPYSTLHVGMLQGGTALNIVPDTATLEFEYRNIAGDCPNTLLNHIYQRARKVESRYRSQFEDASIVIEQYNSYPGLNTPREQTAVSMVQYWAQSNTVTKVPFGTEAGYFDDLGIPTVVCGPGSMEGQGHKPNEYITKQQLAACDAMLDRLLREISD